MSDGEHMSDHDLLIRIDERVNKLDRCMTNHLRHHWVVTTAALTARVVVASRPGAVTDSSRPVWKPVTMETT